MLRGALAAIALATLGACASLPTGPSAVAAPLSSFDDSAPIEEPAPHWSVQAAGAAALNRREFNPRIWRRPDMRPLIASAADRVSRHMRRRRRLQVRNRLSAQSTTVVSSRRVFQPSTRSAFAGE